MIRLVPFASVVLAACAASVARADTLQVPADHPTIQAAIDAATDGDQIVIRKGTYAEAVVIDGASGKNNLTLRGRGKPLLDGAGQATCLTIVNASGITVVGLTFQGADRNGVLVQDSTGVTITKCISRDMGNGGGLEGAGVHLTGGSGHTVESNRIEDCERAGIRFSRDAGSGTTDCVIAGNKIFRGQAGICVDGGGHTVRGNKVKDVGFQGILVEDEAAPCTFDGNLVKRSGDYAVAVVGGTHTFRANRFVQTQTTGVWLGSAGSGTTFDGDKIIKSSSTGIEVDADGTTLRNLKVVGSGDHGIDVDATGCLVEGCKVIRTKDDAFKARRGGNTFRGNKAKKSRDRDLDDDAGQGANTYEDNKFDPDKVNVQL